MVNRLPRLGVVAAHVVAAVAVGCGTAQAATTQPVRPAVSSDRTQEQPTSGSVVGSEPGYLVVGEGLRLPGARAPDEHSVVVGGHAFTVVDCGWLSCSLHLSHSQTRWLAYNVAAAGGVYGGVIVCASLAATSTVGAAFVAAWCAVVVAVYGGFIQNAFTCAAADSG